MVQEQQAIRRAGEFRRRDGHGGAGAFLLGEQVNDDLGFGGDGGGKFQVHEEKAEGRRLKAEG